MSSPASRRPTPKEAAALKLASAHELGHLPGDTSAAHIEAMLRERWIYGQDADSYRLEPEVALREIGTAVFRILPAGRRALLSSAQWRALVPSVQHRDAVGPLTGPMTRATLRCLADLRLVECRNAEGEVSTDGGRAGFHPYRSALGDEVVAASAVHDT